MSFDSKWLKIAGFAVTVIGFGVNWAAAQISEKQLDLKIEEKVNDIINHR